MNEDIIKKWVAALRSGEYRQAVGKLVRGNRHGRNYCCLGVLEQILLQDGVIKSHSKDREMLDASIAEKVDSDLPQDTLVKMNDGGDSFTFIAGWLEERYKLKE